MLQRWDSRARFSHTGGKKGDKGEVGQTADNLQGNLTLMDGHSCRQIWLILGGFHWGRTCSSALNGPAFAKPVGKYRIQKSGVGKEKVWEREVKHGSKIL